MFFNMTLFAQGYNIHPMFTIISKVVMILKRHVFTKTAFFIFNALHFSKINSHINCDPCAPLVFIPNYIGLHNLFTFIASGIFLNSHFPIFSGPIFFPFHRLIICKIVLSHLRGLLERFRLRLEPSGRSNVLAACFIIQYF